MKTNLINIINYKFFKYSNKNYCTVVKKILDSSPLQENNVTVTYLENPVEDTLVKEIFLIDKNGKIAFLHKYNLIKFCYDPKKCKLNHLININIKNEKTYKIIKVLEVLQKDFLKSNNIKELKSINYDDIIQKHNTMFKGYIEKNIISYILNNTWYRDKENKIFTLSYLRPRKHFLQYIRIKSILQRYPEASDILLQKILKDEFQIDISTVQISKVRKRYFIPKKSHRSSMVPYIRFNKYFMPAQKLTKENLTKYKKLSAVYELLDENQIEYDFVKSTTLYIGSSKDLSTRLSAYVYNHAHTDKLKEYIEGNVVYFRFIVTKNYKEVEKIILNEFQEYYGSLPILNSNRLHL